MFTDTTGRNNSALQRSTRLGLQNLKFKGFGR